MVSLDSNGRGSPTFRDIETNHGAQSVARGSTGLKRPSKEAAHIIPTSPNEAEVDMIRNTVFTSLMAFIVVWTVISAYGLIQAIAGFPDTYASIVASSPTLATGAARQSILQGVILHSVFKWLIVAAPLALFALLAKR
jgi:hypothetical protein